MTLLTLFESNCPDLKSQILSAASKSSIKSIICKFLSDLVDYKNEYRQSITEQEDLMLKALIRNSPLFSSEMLWLDKFMPVAASAGRDSQEKITLCSIAGASVGLAIGSLSNRIIPTLLTSLIIGSAAYAVAKSKYIKNTSMESPAIDVDGVLSYIHSNLESIDELMAVFSAQLSRLRASFTE